MTSPSITLGDPSLPPVGTITYAERHWKVDAKPHVMLRLRRMFSRLQGSVGAVSIPYTLDTCQDLLWLCGRYPFTATPEDARRLTEGAEAQTRRIIEQTQILDASHVPPQAGLALPARDYQLRAAALCRHLGDLLLVDELGLGKTCSALATLAGEHPGQALLPALIVCPSHLPRQWAAETKKFLPDWNVHILRKGTPYPLPKDKVNGRGPDLIISNYHKLSGWAESLAGHLKAVVFDEAQELRSGEGTRKYAAAQHIAEHVDVRLLLTATPIFNYGGEIFNLLNVMRPNCLGSWQEFATEWCTHTDIKRKARLKDPAAFGAYAREQGLMLSRTRADVGRELPETVRVTQEIDADEYQFRQASSPADELARMLLKQSEGLTGRGEAMEAAGRFEQIVRQATGLAKAPAVAAFVTMLLDSGEKVVLCGWHHACYDVWQDRLEKEDVRCVRYTGTESPAAKDAAVNAFLTPCDQGGAQVILLSLRSGSGLNGLQEVCSNIVFGELDWSPGIHEQCIGRLRRDGLAGTVNAFYLISATGSDPVMARVLGLKESQALGVVNPNADPSVLVQTDARDRIKELAEEHLRRKAA